MKTHCLLNRNNFEIWYSEDASQDYNKNTGNHTSGNRIYRVQIINRNIEPAKDTIMFCMTPESLEDIGRRTDEEVQTLWDTLIAGDDKFREDIKIPYTCNWRAF